MVEESVSSMSVEEAVLTGKVENSSETALDPSETVIEIGIDSDSLDEAEGTHIENEG